MKPRRYVQRNSQHSGLLLQQLWRNTPVENQDEQRASSIDGPPEDAIYQEVTYVDDFGQSKTAIPNLVHDVFDATDIKWSWKQKGIIARI
ncbi:hypothetical protein QVD17_08820 [Tagetes erecta]|uniref:Uncharacterized protein n=1 Tax=Tagetes erecta TaxID=13708 RepID=A0AAD8L676_TARER|nr:hypothetical protein QVD17_08820 [Tagetes erecta]